MALFNWISKNLLLVVLILAVVYLSLRPNYPGPIIPMIGERSMTSYDQGVSSLSAPAGESLKLSTTDSRIVLQETNLSLLVDNVRGVADNVLAKAKELGGFMVSASFNQPEESPFATISIRVPTENLDGTLEYLRAQAVKVSSENLYGTDVTEAYQDLEAQLTTLEKTQAKLNELLDKATNVTDILNVQRELSSIQQQIDVLKGQKESFEENATLTRITVYLSTDELALPYVPDKSFRPNLIFKQAVRSLVESFRSVGEGLIWLGVYSVYWVPALAILYFLRRRFK